MIPGLTQWVKDLALSLLGLGSMLRLRFDSWPGNFCMPWMWHPKNNINNKNSKKKKHTKKHKVKVVSEVLLEVK